MCPPTTACVLVLLHVCPHTVCVPGVLDASVYFFFIFFWHQAFWTPLFNFFFISFLGISGVLDASRFPAKFASVLKEANLARLAAASRVDGAFDGGPQGAPPRANSVSAVANSGAALAGGAPPPPVSKIPQNMPKRPVSNASGVSSSTASYTAAGKAGLGAPPPEAGGGGGGSRSGGGGGSGSGASTHVRAGGGGQGGGGNRLFESQSSTTIADGIVGLGRGGGRGGGRGDVFASP